TCPLATIALWRNHPWSGDGHPEDACFMTREEIDDALRPHAPAVQFVQVNARVACWWTQRQIARAAGLPVLLPIPGQHRPRHIALAPPSQSTESVPIPPDDRDTGVARQAGSTPDWNRLRI